MAQQHPTRRPANQQGKVNWLDHPDLSGNAAAFAHGAGDAFSMGLADVVSSGAKATNDFFQGRGFRAPYQRYMAAEAAQDRYEDSHYRRARIAGRGTGTAAQFAAIGPEALAARGGLRIAEAAKLAGRELMAMAGGGALTGATGKVLTDGLSRRRGSVGDFAGAAAGGAVGALAATTGFGSVAGAAGGATNSLVRDAVDGRLDRGAVGRAVRDAGSGALLGGIGGRAGRLASDRQPIKTKEQIGEFVARVRADVRGDAALAGPKRAYSLLDGKKTFPDARTVKGNLLEAKFGNTAHLSKNQLQAQNELNHAVLREEKKLPDFLTYHTRPKDIGAAVGTVTSGLLSPSFDDY